MSDFYTLILQRKSWITHEDGSQTVTMKEETLSAVPAALVMMYRKLFPAAVVSTTNYEFKDEKRPASSTTQARSDKAGHGVKPSTRRPASMPRGSSTVTKKSGTSFDLGEMINTEIASQP